MSWEGEQGRFLVRSFGGLDLLLVLMSFVICHYIYLGSLEFSPERLLMVMATLISGYLGLSLTGLYRTDRNYHLNKIVTLLSLAWLCIALFVSMLAFLSKIAVEVSRAWFALSMTSAYISLVCARIVSGLLHFQSNKRGLSGTRIVLIGRQQRISSIQSRIANAPHLGYRVVKKLAFVEDFDAEALDQLSIEETFSRLMAFVEHQRQINEPVSEVWIALPLAEEGLIKSAINRLRNTSVDVCVAHDAFGRQLIMGTVQNVSDIPIVNVSDIRLSGSAEAFKNVFDFCFSLILLILILPFLILVAIAIKMDSSGPVLFKQLRYGMDGAAIQVWKFRTMKVSDVTTTLEVVQATRNDSRVTRIGKYLRKYSIDELPQFYNVLQGKMSIVGPRPHAVSHNEEYRVKIDGYMLRHKIKPGITGWAQVNGWRGETETLQKMEKRVRYDLDYISNWSAWFDLKIILMTVFGVFFNKNVY